MWLMLQQDEPDDYVIATNETHSVEKFVELAFSYTGLNWKDFVVIDEKFYRPAETVQLRGDFTKARLTLNWSPTVKFEELVKMMIDHDIAVLNESGKGLSTKL